MSYGIISAWKSASEYEQVEQFLYAILSVNEEYLLENCSEKIEFVDVVRNQIITGTNQLLSYLKDKWSSNNSGFEIKNLKVAFTETSEVASFKLTRDSQELQGLILIEVSNGKISLCRFALGDI